MSKSVTLLLFCLFSFDIHAQWNLVFQDSLYEEIQDIHFFNKDIGLVCGMDANGHGFVLKTVNGGNSWNNIPTWQIPAGFYSIDFINNTTGFMAGQDGGVYKSTNSGDTWSWVTNVNPTNDIDQIYFISDSISFIRNANGDIWKSIDQALTWTNVLIAPTNIGLQRKKRPIFFINDSVGYNASFGIYKTTDQGNNWIRLNVDTINHFRTTYALDANHIYVVGNNGVLLRTSNGGINWTLDTICSQDLRDIIFVNNSIGFCVGGGFEFNNDTTGVVLRTIDGGLSWTKNSISNERLNSIQIIDSVGYIVGNNGKIFKNTFGFPTSINNLPANYYDFYLSPNPSNNKITFEIKDLYKNVFYNLLIFDMQGNIIFEELNTLRNTISVAEFPSGTYLLQLETKNGRILEKFIVTK